MMKWKCHDDVASHFEAEHTHIQDDDCDDIASQSRQ